SGVAIGSLMPYKSYVQRLQGKRRRNNPKIQSLLEFMRDSGRNRRYHVGFCDKEWHAHIVRRSHNSMALKALFLEHDIDDRSVFFDRSCYHMVQLYELVKR